MGYVIVHQVNFAIHVCSVHHMRCADPCGTYLIPRDPFRRRNVAKRFAVSRHSNSCVVPISRRSRDHAWFRRPIHGRQAGVEAPTLPSSSRAWPMRTVNARIAQINGAHWQCGLMCSELRNARRVLLVRWRKKRGCCDVGAVTDQLATTIVDS